MTIVLALLAGILLGYILERGDFCFHSTLRGLFRIPAKMNLFRAYLVTLLIAVPAVQVMIALGWIQPWVAPFVWQANIIGGVLFGVGMVVASTCVTGLFYKLGHGMLGVLLAMLTWGIGDVLIYEGPLRFLRESLNRSPVQVNGEVATATTLLTPTLSIIVLIVLAAAALFYLWQSRQSLFQETLNGETKVEWSWLKLGIITGVFMSAVWFLAEAGGSNYTFGTSYVPTSLFKWISSGNAIPLWIPISLFSIIIGAFIAAKQSGTLWIRGESPMRYVELGAGGLLLGIGGGIAGGCNLGHGLVGVPLLSMGSITTTLSMALGVFVAHRVSVMISTSHTTTD
ncbi:MAG: YeeE/YedE family protein [Chloroflexota bacterium]